MPGTTSYTPVARDVTQRSLPSRRHRAALCFSERIASAIGSVKSGTVFVGRAFRCAAVVDCRDGVRPIHFRYAAQRRASRTHRHFVTSAAATTYSRPAQRRTLASSPRRSFPPHSALFNPPHSAERMAATCSRNRGQRLVAARHTTCQSIPKYACTSMLRKATVWGHGTSAWRLSVRRRCVTPLRR